MTRLIVTADDLGRSHSINHAIIRAHREGILTSASLMVTGEAAKEAVDLAKDNAALAVGLHLVLVSGRSVLPSSRIPHLVDDRGRFSKNPWRAGWLYFRSRAARDELRSEMEAQFERFSATGLPLSHVDGHYHMHMHPTIFDLLLPLAESHGAGGVRLPRDDLRLGLRYDARGRASKIVTALTFDLLCRRAEGRLAESNLRRTQRVCGLLQTGRMKEAYILMLLRELHVPCAEFYFHPALEHEGEPLGPDPGDLATLLSPQVRQTIEERQIRLVSYVSLGEEVRH